jgi:hypothetical protein
MHEKQQNAPVGRFVVNIYLAARFDFQARMTGRHFDL